MIGVAFSLGFTVGPLLGAYFAINSKDPESVFYQTPALLALAFSAADLLFIFLALPETLTDDVKVGCETLRIGLMQKQIYPNKGVLGSTSLDSEFR